MAEFLKNKWTVRVLTLIASAAAFLASGVPLDAASIGVWVSGAITMLLGPQIGKGKAPDA